jgi:hypothetical protein
MVSGSVAEGRIRIATSPSQDGGTVNDEVTGPNESFSDGISHGENEERLVQRRASTMTAFALLGFARNADVSLLVPWQATSQSQSRPTLEPVAHILIR